MKLYTKGGDGGTTELFGGERVEKTDLRIELLGMLDELSAHLGLCRVTAPEHLSEFLLKIQKELCLFMSGICQPENEAFMVQKEHILAIEQEIDRIDRSLKREVEWFFCERELSARLDVSRTIARRAERVFWSVKKTHPLDDNFAIYLNRISDYLYIAARSADRCENP